MAVLRGLKKHSRCRVIDGKDDSTLTFDKVLEYECEGVEGCTITHTSDHETAVDEYPIKYESADNDGDGVADFVVDMKVSAVLKITVESKTCN